jgi:hypothetical protein
MLARGIPIPLATDALLAGIAGTDFDDSFAMFRRLSFQKIP